MATLPKDTNTTKEWKAYPNSSDFSGMVQNLCDSAVYMQVVTIGETPTEEDGVVLPQGIGSHLPVTIPDTEELVYKPVAAGPVTLRLA